MLKWVVYSCPSLTELKVISWREWMSKPEDDPFDKAVRLGQTNKCANASGWTRRLPTYPIARNQTSVVQGQDAEWYIKHNLWSCNEMQNITYDHAMKCNQDNDVTLNECINVGCIECEIQTLRSRKEESELEIQTRHTREEYLRLRSKRVLRERSMWT